MIFLSRTFSTFHLLAGLFMISSITPVKAIDFIASEFDVGFKAEFDMEIAALNAIRNYRQIPEDWVQTDFFSRLGKTIELSLLDIAQYAPLVTDPPGATCRDGTFGYDGRYTDAVCSVYEAIINDICPETDPKESSCVRADIPYLIPAKGTMLDQPNITNGQDANFAWALCLVVADLNATECDETNLDGDKLLAGNTAGLQMEQFPGLDPDLTGFNNPLLTFANEKLLPEANNVMWSKYALGDGRFELIRRLYNQQPFRQPDDPKYREYFRNSRPNRWEILDAKASAVNTIVQQYAYQAFSDASVNEYYHDVLLGYFMQRYGDKLFGAPIVGNTERTAVMEGALFRYRTACALPLGVMAAHYCGYDAEDMKDFTISFLASDKNTQESSGFKVAVYPTCGKWSRPMWQLAKQAMMKTESQTPLFQSTMKMPHSFCLNRIFRFQ